MSILTSEATPRLTGSGFAVARVRVAARRVRRRRVRIWNLILAVGWGVEWCVVEYRRSFGIWSIESVSGRREGNESPWAMEQSPLCHLVPRYCWSLMSKNKEPDSGLG